MLFVAWCIRLFQETRLKLMECFNTLIRNASGRASELLASAIARVPSMHLRCGSGTRHCHGNDGGDEAPALVWPPVNTIPKAPALVGCPVNTILRHPKGLVYRNWHTPKFQRDVDSIKGELLNSFVHLRRPCNFRGVIHVWGSDGWMRPLLKQLFFWRINFLYKNKFSYKNIVLFIKRCFFYT